MLKLKKKFEIYLENQGIDINLLFPEEYKKLEDYYNNWVINNIASEKVLEESSYSPYSTDYRHIQFARLAEVNKANLEDEIARLKPKARLRG